MTGDTSLAGPVCSMNATCAHTNSQGVNLVTSWPSLSVENHENTNVKVDNLYSSTQVSLCLYTSTIHVVCDQHDIRPFLVTAPVFYLLSQIKYSITCKNISLTITATEWQWSFSFAFLIRLLYISTCEGRTFIVKCTIPCARYSGGLQVANPLLPSGYRDLTIPLNHGEIFPQSREVLSTFHLFTFTGTYSFARTSVKY
jgi:hypothetical protein